MRLHKTLSVIVLAFEGLILCVSAQTQRIATATPTVVNGFVIAATVTDGGAGYATPPIVTISGGGGNGAIAIATVLNGAVDKVIVQNTGHGYTGTPIVVIDPPQSLKPPFSEGLVAYYPFNGNANDESSMGNNGTVNGATLTTDRFGDQGKAMAFNGINQYIQASDKTYLQRLGSTFTISCWVNLNDPTQPQHFIGKGEIAGFKPDWIFEYGPQSGSTTPLGMSFCVWHISTNAFYASSNWTPAPATWHHYLFTKTASENGTYFTLFLDGRLESLEEGTSMRSSTSPLTIGQAGGSGWVNGMMDDVRIYNRALSAQEVQDLYAYEAPEQPSLTINVETVRVTMRVKPTKKYQLEASLDLNKWTNAGDVFTATSSEISQQFNAIEVGRFFRLSEVP